MSDTSARLGLPYLQPAQAQKHVTHNDALARLDVLVQLSVEALAAETPPAGPAEGAVWGLGAAPTGDWAGHPGQLAAFVDGGWVFFAPGPGWRAWDAAQGALMVHDGTDWAAVGGGGLPDLDNLPGLGVNTGSDPINRLAVAAEATLLTHEGAGHQVKVNKAAPGDTASLLFQSNWSGRAEMGLAGNDDFSVKVSPDGSSFVDALVIDRTTGEATFPNSRPRVQAPLNYRYYGYTDNRWVAPTNIPGNENATQDLGNGAEPSLDFDATGLFLPGGTQIETMQLNLRVNSPQWSDFNIRVFFQYGPWDGSWSDNASTSRDVIHAADAVGLLSGTGYHRLNPVFAPYLTPDDGHLILAFQPIGSLTSNRFMYLTGRVTVRMAGL